MVDSRLNTNPPFLFHCFVDIVSPQTENPLAIRRIFPDDFVEKDDILKQIPGFCYPCAIDHDGVQYSTFVLTDIDSKFRFGFCRYPPHATHCCCIISYLPWFETFYAVLDKLTEFGDDFQAASKFLELLNNQEIPEPGTKLKFNFNFNGKKKNYIFVIPDTTKLPTIPDNRNLTEYFAKVTPENMVYLFISMLFERRIIVTSEKLSVLTAVVHGSVSLLYPMQWQHIYVPILPPNLIDYCCAPMPFLLGIHSSMMETVRRMPMNEVVILNADTNELEQPQEDLDVFPSKVFAKLKRRLQRTDQALNDYVSSQFLQALADLMGGYRNSLKCTAVNGDVVFDEELFLNSRSGSTKAFLQYILDLQSFRQFIAGRLDMINDGVNVIDIFEQAVLQRNADLSNETKMSVFRGKVKSGGVALKKSVGGKYSHLKGIASEVDVKEFKKKIKEKVKDVKVAMKTKDPSPTESAEDVNNMKRNNSMPLSQKYKIDVKKSERHSTYSSLPRRDVIVPGKTPPPRPPRPVSNIAHAKSIKDTNSVEMPFKNYPNAPKCSKSHSEPNICALADDSNSLNLRRSSTELNSTAGIGTPDSILSLDSDSFPEHMTCFSNPAFHDPHEYSFIIASEEVTSLEHNLLSGKQLETVKRPDNLLISRIPKKPTLKRSTPVTPVETTKRPPPRPPPISPVKAKTPIRPPLPKSANLIDTTSPDIELPDAIYSDRNRSESLKFNDDFVNISLKGNEGQAVNLPNSPFFMPSAALLGLDLFSDTISSLSVESRSLIADQSKRSSSFVNIDSENDFSTSNNRDFGIFNESGTGLYEGDKFKLNRAFNETLPSMDKVHRSPVLTHEPIIKRDPFAAIFDEAKKDLQLNKR